jgi:hypothetical protein
VFVRAVVTKYHELADLNDRNLFFTFLESEKCKIKVLAK